MDNIDSHIEDGKFSLIVLMMGAQIILDTPILKLSCHAYCTLASPQFSVTNCVCLSKDYCHACPFGMES
jgi:hypothetical protein